MRTIFESHFISSTAFDILLRRPSTSDDFEAFIAERQRTLHDAIENLLIKERLDLSQPLRDLDFSTEQIELRIRQSVNETPEGDAPSVPSHVLQKVDERILRAIKKNASLDSERFRSLEGKLQYFDLRELQDTITSKVAWPLVAARFGSRESLATKFDQLAELRNGIRRSRDVGEVVRKEGEAAIIWFRQVMARQ